MAAYEVEKEVEKELEGEEDESYDDMPFTTGAVISASLYRYKRLKKKKKLKSEKEF
jgi:hypothetical protein